MRISQKWLVAAIAISCSISVGCAKKNTSENHTTVTPSPSPAESPVNTDIDENDYLDEALIELEAVDE